jgi:hypothetical protein
MFKFIDLISKVTVVTDAEKMSAGQKRFVKLIGGRN